jgi:predicted nucleic acid-binding protein
VILADTTIWVDHLRVPNTEMQRLLNEVKIAIHPFVVAELALGSLRDRTRTLARLEMLTQVRVAQLGEVRRLIEAHSLWGKGIGLTDVHLIASTLITPNIQLWTRDRRLRSVAESLGIAAGLA